MKTTRGEASQKPNSGKGGNMGQHKMEEGRKSCRCKMRSLLWVRKG